MVCRPDWQRHGRAAPFRRNDELLALLPKGLIAFEGGGITASLFDKAKALGYQSFTHDPPRRTVPTSVTTPAFVAVNAMMATMRFDAARGRGTRSTTTGRASSGSR